VDLKPLESMILKLEKSGKKNMPAGKARLT
jgi:hypothetical protein